MANKLEKQEKEENKTVLKTKEEFFKDKEMNIQNTISYLQYIKDNDVHNPFRK